MFPKYTCKACNIEDCIIYYRGDSLFRELPLPLYCAIVFSFIIAVDNECVWVFIGIKDNIIILGCETQTK